MSELISIPSLEIMKTVVNKNNTIKRSQFVSIFCNTVLARLIHVYNKPATSALYAGIKTFTYMDQVNYKLYVDFNILLTIAKQLKITNLEEIDINLRDLSISIAKSPGWFVRYYPINRSYFDVYTFDPDNCGQWYEVSTKVNNAVVDEETNWDDALRPLDTGEQNAMARVAQQTANMRRFAEQLRQEPVFYRPRT